MPTPYWSWMDLLEVGSRMPSLLVEHSFFLALPRSYLIAWEGPRAFSRLINIIYFSEGGRAFKQGVVTCPRLAVNSPSFCLSFPSVGLYPDITSLYLMRTNTKARYSKGFSQLRGPWVHCRCSLQWWTNSYVRSHFHVLVLVCIHTQEIPIFLS